MKLTNRQIGTQKVMGPPPHPPDRSIICFPYLYRVCHGSGRFRWAGREMWYLPFRFFKFDRFVNEIPDFSCSIFSRNTVPAQTCRFPLCFCKKVTFLGSQAEISSPLVTPKMSLFCRYKGGITIFLALRACSEGQIPPFVSAKK